MTFFKTLFKRTPDPKTALRPLWHRTVELSRDPAWYAEDGMPDTVQGRFDMITLVLGMVLVRMESDDTLKAPSVLLTELFVDDMEGQLRESGMGDPTVGKQIGKLMEVLGGRLGALREADSDEAIAAIVARNTEVEDADRLASRLARFSEKLATLDADAILAGEIAL